MQKKHIGCLLPAMPLLLCCCLPATMVAAEEVAQPANTVQSLEDAVRSINSAVQTSIEVTQPAETEQSSEDTPARDTTQPVVAVPHAETGQPAESAATVEAEQPADELSPTETTPLPASGIPAVVAPPPTTAPTVDATQPAETAPPAEAVQQIEQPQPEPAASDSAKPDIDVEYSRKGADTCMKCHDEDSEYPVLDIFKTRHGVRADPRSPFATLQCETCHGPGVKGMQFMEAAKEAGSHVGKVRPGEKRPPILNFGDKSDEPVEAQNQMCLSCHKGDRHIAWPGSAHESAGVACANCHTIHTPYDPVMDKAAQANVCYKCHQKQRAEFLRTSSHPVRFGQMTCSDCHAAHGTGTTTLLGRPTLNETCYTCHAEKRGPFLWEHAPASEDCSLCHTPHGSVHPSLLKKRPPLLCQQCHSQIGHPSVSLNASGLPGGSGGASGLMLAGSCTNCHSQVHGSNHPSGVKLMR